MRRAFKASDEGGTGLVGVADFRKVSQLSASVPRASREQVPRASGKPAQRRALPRAGGPGVSSCPLPHFLGTPRLSRAEARAPSPADPRLSSLKISRALGDGHSADAGAQRPSGPWAPHEAGPSLASAGSQDRRLPHRATDGTEA